MAEAAADPNQEQRLQASRAQYLSSLNARLTALHEALNTVSAGGVGETHSALVRRLRAMADAAGVLGYEEMGNAFRAAFELLSLDDDGAVSARAIHESRSLLDLVPSLVPDAPRDEPPALASLDQLRELGPLALVCMISAGQQVLLRRALRGLEGTRIGAATTLAELQTLVTSYEPDWIFVDGRRADALEAVARLRMRAVLVLDAPEHVAGRLKAAGARHVAREGVSLVTTLLDAIGSQRARSAESRPKSDTSTIGRVVDASAQELRESLLVGLSPHEAQQLLTPAVQSTLEALTWSAISRMREVITEASGGAIQYPERAPEGAVMVTGRSALRHSRHPSADSSNLRGRRVLVADDDSSVVWFLSSILRAAGAEVFEARDGLEALRVARRSLPDLIISDVMMPELDGFALCRNLKRDVLLSDVPVILLSWKEDLLQRVHELGAGAAGYLPKETEATVIVERCCEALEPRVRIERRLREKEIVHGRLDGVTPRLVLELAAATLDNAQVSFCDAAFTYHLSVNDGRVVVATRRGRDGVEQRGEGVLPGLLGMRAGRFSVEPSKEVPKAELFGSLSKLIAPHVERARRTASLLQGTRIYDVQRLDIDYAGIAPYLASSPVITTKLVERLVQGVAPSALLHQVSAGLLESVLTDLAQRGAVLAAWDIGGNDLIALSEEPLEAFDVDLGPPKPGTLLESAKGAPKVTAQSTSRDAERAAEFAERAAASIAVKPTPDTQREPLLVELLAEDEQAPPTAAIEDDIVTPPFSRSSVEAEPNAGPLAAVESEVAASAEAPAPAAGLIGIAPVVEAASEFGAGLVARRQKQRPTLTGLGFPSPPRNLDWNAFTTAGDKRAADAPADALDALFSDSPVPPRAADASSSVPEAVAALNADEGFEPAERSAARKTALHAAVVSRVTDHELDEHLPAAPMAEPSQSEASDKSVVGLELGSALLDSALATPRRRVDLEPASQPLLAATLKHSESAGPAPSAPKVSDALSDALLTRSDEGSERPVALGQEVSVAGERLSRPSDGALRARLLAFPRLARALIPAAVVLGTAGAVFGLSSGLWQLLGLEKKGDPSVAPAALAVQQQAAALSPAEAEARDKNSAADDEELSGANAAGRVAELRSSLMDMPSDIQVEKQKGLLDLDTDGQHKIYVNDAFFGRGPVKRMPLAAGTYKLTLRLDGAEQSFPFEIVVGRRTRLESVAVGAERASAAETAGR